MTSTSMGTDNLRPPAPGHLVADTIEIKKYYFASYEDYQDQTQQVILDEHPLAWQKVRRDHVLGSQWVTIIGWQPLSKEEYEQFKDQI